jgi:hypothetical protein
MRTHILMSICVGVIFATTSIGAFSDVGPRMEIVDRAHKGDRLPVALVSVLRAPVHGLELPEGCDALVSLLARTDLARIAGRCES